MNKHSQQGISFGNKLIYEVIAAFVLLFCKIALGFKAHFDREVLTWKRSKTPFIMLCAHPSEVDAIVLLSACFPRYTRFVAGAQQLYKGLQGKMLRIIKVIPKRQYVADIFAIKEMMKTVKQGYVLGMMPEGRVSMDGTPNPNDLSTAKLLKKLCVPVAIIIPHGTYFVKPAYNYKGIKRGKISADINVLFTKEDLQNLSEEEILKKLQQKCDYNAPEELRGTGHTYGSQKNPAMLGVSRILYRCPYCNSLYTMKDDGKVLKCCACEKSAKLSNHTFIESEGYFPDTISAWNKNQLDFEHDFWKEQSNKIEFTTKKYMLTLGQEIAYSYKADGVITLDKDGFHYVDCEETIEIKLSLFQGVSVDYEHGFLTYYQGNDIRRFKLENCQYVARFVNSLMVLKGLK